MGLDIVLIDGSTSIVQFLSRTTKFDSKVTFKNEMHMNKDTQWAQKMSIHRK